MRPHARSKDGKDHTYWSLVETVRTADGPRQKTLCHLGELNRSAQARWLRTVEVLNGQGEAQQRKLFRRYPSTALDDLPAIEEGKVNDTRLYRSLDRILPHKTRLERRLKQRYGGLFEAEFDVLRRITEPTAEPKSQLHQLGLSLPERLDFHPKM